MMDVKTAEAYIINDYFSQNAASDYLNDFIADKIKDAVFYIGEKGIGESFTKIIPLYNFLEFIIEMNKEIQRTNEKKMFANAYYSAKSKGTGVVIKRIVHYARTKVWQQGFFQSRWITNSSISYEYYEIEDFCTNQKIEELITFAVIF